QYKARVPADANLSTSKAHHTCVEASGCALFMTKIGEVNVTEAMQREQAVIGGEGNGGVIYPRINFARDSLVGMALILHYLAETGQTISELVERIPHFSMIKEGLECPSHKLAQVLRLIRREYVDYPMDTRDGVKVIMPDAWFLVRGSNTEPIVRVMAEAPDARRAEQLMATVHEQVRACINSGGR